MLAKCSCFLLVSPHPSCIEKNHPQQHAEFLRRPRRNPGSMPSAWMSNPFRQLQLRQPPQPAILSILPSDPPWTRHYTEPVSLLRFPLAPPHHPPRRARPLFCHPLPPLPLPM